MASHASSDDDIITGINVTPLVDITLVLLVILMITASYVASQTIPMELPRSATGEPATSSLAISVRADGELFLDATPVTETALRERVRTARLANPEQHAVVAADGRTPHARVVAVIDLLRQEQVTKFAINVDPTPTKP